MVLGGRLTQSQSLPKESPGCLVEAQGTYLSEILVGI